MVAVLVTVHCHVCFAQNTLYIPPALTGTTFNLNVQQGTQIFYGSTSTPTYGINSSWMAPTIIVNKGDSITLNVTNQLTVKTTIHWHGLHVAPNNDGGPHQLINPSASWNPTFKIRNNAATYFYHPHGAGQTEKQISKGLAGFLIVKDSVEAALTLPRTYGVDDVPLNVQTKAFDVLQQIAIATDMDTAIFVNGTLHPNFNAHAQVIRFRLLNASSLRTYNFGLSNGQTFYQIATDGGLLDSSLALTRLRLSPGERAEILINFSGMTGQTIFLKSFASELPNGIYGADTVGMGADTIPQYESNFLNGADFNLLQLTVVTQTTNPVTTIPTTLIPLTPYSIGSASNFRTLIFDTIRLLPLDVPNLAEGPFGMNKRTFDMDSINETVNLNTTEIWTLVNHTLVAHPFHIHDVQFNVIEKSGLPTPATERGWKDVVLVMPHDSIKFITKFETFANNTIPYMYHCHLLHHEDDGMMGQFIVSAGTTGIGEITKGQNILVYPNPFSSGEINVSTEKLNNFKTLYSISNLLGEALIDGISTFQDNLMKINTSNLPSGIYFLKISCNNQTFITKIVKQ